METKLPAALSTTEVEYIDLSIQPFKIYTHHEIKREIKGTQVEDS